MNTMPEVEFSLDHLATLCIHHDEGQRASNEIYQKVGELSDILFDSDSSDVDIFKEYTREEIEWFCDTMVYWPYTDGEGNEGVLSHLGVQQRLMPDIITSLSSCRSVSFNKKGVVFI